MRHFSELSNRRVIALPSSPFVRERDYIVCYAIAFRNEYFPLELSPNPYYEPSRYSLTMLHSLEYDTFFAATMRSLK